jgi:predicted nucleotidyltransferase
MRMSRKRKSCLKTIDEGIQSLVDGDPRIVIAYLFGSRATSEGDSVSNADWDFAFLLEPDIEEVDRELFKYRLQAALSSQLRTDRVDVVLLNASRSIELAHAVVSDGVCFLDRHPDREAFERRIRHEYQDHCSALERNGFASPK